MTAVVFTFVLLLGSALKELLPLLMAQRATLGAMAQAFGLLIPFVWVFALPMGLLTATLLVFGRFSADQELTAARASGVSLVSLTTPILILSLACCAVSAVVNMEIAPRCRVAYNQLRSSWKAALASVQLPEQQPITAFPGYIIFIGKNREHKLEDVRLCALKDNTNVEYTLYAPRGQFETDAAHQTLTLHLYDAQIIGFSQNDSYPMSVADFPLSFDLGEHEKNTGGPKISDMTFSQLRAALRDVEQRMNLPLSAQAGTSADQRKKEAELRKVRNNLTESIRVQMHREVAFSFACFGFTLIGIPLGIRVHRRETNIGIAIALGLVAVYYALIIAGESLSGHPELAPHLFMWAPNFLFEAAGAVLLWRANRGI